MKKQIAKAILLIVTCQGHAQNISGDYSYRIGDKVNRHIVEYAAEADTNRE